MNCTIKTWLWNSYHVSVNVCMLRSLYQYVEGNYFTIFWFCAEDNTVNKLLGEIEKTKEKFKEELEKLSTQQQKLLSATQSAVSRWSRNSPVLSCNKISGIMSMLKLSITRQNCRLYYQNKLLGKFKEAICNHKANCVPFDLWSDVSFGDLQTWV